MSKCSHDLQVGLETPEQLGGPNRLSGTVESGVPGSLPWSRDQRDQLSEVLLGEATLGALKGSMNGASEEGAILYGRASWLGFLECMSDVKASTVHAAYNTTKFTCAVRIGCL